MKKVVTITCDDCKKNSYINENDFPLYCSFCGSRESIYYLAEKGSVDLQPIKSIESKDERM